MVLVGLCSKKQLQLSSSFHAASNNGRLAGQTDHKLSLHFIFDRVMGKPKQDVSLTGGVIHAHVRDPLLASLPKEALEALARSYDDVLAKYAKPVLDVSQDGPHNQIESNRAIGASEPK
jgi:hypothetical protein